MAPLLYRRYRGRCAWALALVLAAGCRSATEQPGPGTALLDVRLGAGAQMPDELRASVYDDAGVIWQDVRFPSSGALVARSPTDLGTILLEPGATGGALRVDLRGLLGGVLVDEATLAIPAASISGGTFEATLSASLPADTDGDGVPDPIDDCPSVPDPTQTGCAADAGARDGGVRDAAVADRDAAADARRDGATTSRDAGRDVPRGNKGTGSGCGGANECASGFCTDGVCCDKACTDTCESCVSGTCTEVKNGEDVPQCVAPMTCNKKGKCVAADAGNAS
jgi:hypothetical protein